MRTSTKLTVLGIAILCMMLLPYIGEAWRSAVDAKARQAAAEALKNAAAQMPARLTFAKLTLSAEANDAPEQDDRLLSVRQQRCLAHMIDGEAGAEPFDGQKAVAFVAVGRAQDNLPEWGGTDLCKVVCKEGQFDGAVPACKSGMKSPPTDGAMDIAGKVLIGDYKPEGCVARARYFMNPHDSSYKGAMYILKSANVCLTIGNHVFAEPRPKTTVALAKARHKPSHQKSITEASASTTVPQPKKLAAR